MYALWQQSTEKLVNIESVGLAARSGSFAGWIFVT